MCVGRRLFKTAVSISFEVFPQAISFEIRPQTISFEILPQISSTLSSPAIDRDDTEMERITDVRTLSVYLYISSGDEVSPPGGEMIPSRW